MSSLIKVNVYVEIVKLVLKLKENHNAKPMQTWFAR